MAEGGKDKTALLVAALPPPDKLGKGESGGGKAGPDAGYESQAGDAAHEAKVAALAEFDAAPPGSPERVAAFEDAVYACVDKVLKQRGM